MAWQFDPACLPGLATHLVARTLQVRGGGTLEVLACGGSAPPDRRASDWRRCDCLNCRKTNAYKAARKADP